MKTTLIKASKIAIDTFFICSIIIKICLARIMRRNIYFIMGSPLHENLGDQAIAYAEKNFISSNRINSVVILVPMQTVIKHSSLLALYANDNDMLLGHGGGNMGDAYIMEEDCRRKFISSFPNNKIVLFPQTIHFSDTLLGNVELQKSKTIYSAHKNLTLIAREDKSYKDMKKTFTSNKVILTPDIVLSLNMSNPPSIRYGALLCLRNDKEATINNVGRSLIARFAKSKFDKVSYTDTISHKKLFVLRSKNKAFLSKLNEFKQYELVITDRLHGMVFAAITGTPCIALSNFNHKVSGTFAWINKLPYIKFCSDVNELCTSLNDINIKLTYEYNTLNLDEYWNKIKKEIN